MSERRVRDQAVQFVERLVRTPRNVLRESLIRQSFMRENQFRPGAVLEEHCPVRVTAPEPPTRIVWTGGLPLGLFMGRRTFTLTPRDGGVVDFALNLQFSGPLSSQIAKSLGDRQPDIDALAAGLKAWAERASVIE